MLSKVQDETARSVSCTPQSPTHNIFLIVDCYCGVHNKKKYAHAKVWSKHSLTRRRELDGKGMEGGVSPVFYFFSSWSEHSLKTMYKNRRRRGCGITFCPTETSFCSCVFHSASNVHLPRVSPKTHHAFQYPFFIFHSAAAVLMGFIKSILRS